MTALEEIKKALEGVGSLKVEFTPDCDESNSIIAPINDDYDGTFFTVIGCGDKQDKLGGFMAVAVNALPELVSTLESLQRENKRITALVSSSEAERVRSCSELLLRAEAAEAEVKRLRSVLQPMAEVAGDVSESWPDDAQVVTEIGHFRRARTALASTGGKS
ncbi:hypothetical protein [Agrobacterium sp. ST15.13.015]|uniref:hypothetical protein n=1 Tax=Agrobacterium sp. ST15.13.015 TaxID=3017319 RepID=UPI0022CB3095|nr:hypothetical protein [Agrobacterium sp. ST15.13.015]MCZ7501982.1 hypothetical protein [Rhizobium rhizogenes]